jgi:hypothetical protein
MFDWNLHSTPRRIFPEEVVKISVLQLGRFVQADSIIPNPGDPIAFDRYSYVRNSPIRYVDPSGHNYCDSDNALAEDCQGITDLLPDEACRADISCYDAYLAYYWLVLLLGSKPSDLDLLYMTVVTEYWAYSDDSSLAEIAQEGLARNYYASCGRDGCQGSEIYQFLKGYAPWIGRASIIDGTAATRAGNLLSAWNSGANSYVTDHATTILNAKDLGDTHTSWTSGYDLNRPWQWYGPFEWDPSNKPDVGYLSSDDAILAVDLGNNQGFWLFTGAQTEHFNKDAWGPLEAKPQ